MATPKTARVYRTHILNPHTVGEFRKLSASASEAADAFLLYGHQQSGAVPDLAALHGLDPSSVVIRVEADITDLGLPGPRSGLIGANRPLASIGEIIWYNSDFDFYLFWSARREYSYFWFFEWDVFINAASYDAFISRYAHDRSDFIAYDFGPRSRAWYWHKNVSWWHNDLPARRGCFFPVVRLSAGALGFLHQRRLQIFEEYKKIGGGGRWWPMVEVFTATELHGAGFSCCSLDKSDLGRFGCEPFPLSAIPREFDGKLYHPVKSAL